MANKVERKPFELPPEGLVWGTLKEVKDLGKVRDSYGNDRPKLLFTWETDLTDGEGTQIRIFERLTNTLHAKGRLGPRIKDLIGRLPGEEDEVDLTALVGTRAQLMVQHNEASDGRVFANITAVIRAPKDKVVETVKQTAKVDPVKLVIKAIKKGQAAQASDWDSGDAWEPPDESQIPSPESEPG